MEGPHLILSALAAPSSCQFEFFSLTWVTIEIKLTWNTVSSNALTLLDRISFQIRRIFFWFGYDKLDCSRSNSWIAVRVSQTPEMLSQNLEDSLLSIRYSNCFWPSGGCGGESGVGATSVDAIHFLFVVWRTDISWKGIMVRKMLKQTVQKHTVLTVFTAQESGIKEKSLCGPNCAFNFAGLGKNLSSCIIQIPGVQAFLHLP